MRPKRLGREGCATGIDNDVAWRSEVSRSDRAGYRVEPMSDRDSVASRSSGRVQYPVRLSR